MGASQSLDSLTAKQIADHVGGIGGAGLYAGYVKDILDNDVDGETLASTETDKTFKKMLADLGIKKNVHQQKLLSQWKAAKQQGSDVLSEVDRQAIQDFFNQDIKKLKLQEDFIRVERMKWFDNEIDTIYWRRCYSYILCSIMAFFKKVQEDYDRAGDGEEKRKNTMVLTGVQGTGKSILGAVIALFMSKVMQWRVHYSWKGVSTCISQPKQSDGETKILHVVDISQPQQSEFRFPSGFVLIVSSANALRWHSLWQQQTWSHVDGNFCYVNPATKAEVESMAEKLSHTSPGRAWEAFKFVGGVPRICLGSPDAAKALVDAAISEYPVATLVQNLSLLQDSVSQSTTPGTKVYPGLVGHICPTNSFRNAFQIKVPSPYIAQKIAAKEEVDTDDKLQKLMKRLLETPKTRSFGGWLWEPLLTRKMNGGSADITIVGSVLPVTANSPVDTVFQASASQIATLEFENMANFEARAKEWAEHDGDFSVFAKAKSDRFAAIDAILMIRRQDKLIIAALQLTVAEKHHPVLQSMIIEFVAACNRIGDKADLEPEPQLWFLQPEQSLSYFGFVKVQAMEFDEPTLPSPNNDANTDTVRRSTRKRTRREFYGSFGKKSEEKLMSNKTDYWDKSLRSLQQFIGVVRIKEGPSENEGDPIQSAFMKALTNAQAAGGSATEDETTDARDPQLRSWNATVKIMQCLEGYIDDELMQTIQGDIAADKEALEVAGFVFDST